MYAAQKQERAVMARLILIRGVPGSGKTTLAKQYAAEGFQHFEADDYFTHPSDGYRFDRDELKNAHQWCQACTRRAIRLGLDVVVANTFTRRWEMEPYFEMAEQFGADLEVIEATGEWQNVHGVPADVVQAMRARFEA